MNVFKIAAQRYDKSRAETSSLPEYSANLVQSSPFPFIEQLTTVENMWKLEEKKMKTFSCTIQKKVYQPPVMNNAKKIAFIFSRLLNRFFSTFSVGYYAKVINFVHYKQDVDRK